MGETLLMPVRTACQDSPGKRAFRAFRLLPEAALVILVFTSAMLLPGGMLTRHMLAHIVIMSIAAPVLAWSLFRRPNMLGRDGTPYTSLGMSTAVQLGVFLFWHSPYAMASTMDSPAIRLIALGSLFASAIWFWVSVFFSIRHARMIVIAPLLLTGKIVCLVAAILVFAPRLLYAEMATGTAAMADQQLAGLIMLTVCPLTYVGASIAVTAHWFHWLSNRTEAD